MLHHPMDAERHKQHPTWIIIKISQVYLGCYIFGPATEMEESADRRNGTAQIIHMLSFQCLKICLPSPVALNDPPIVGP